MMTASCGALPLFLVGNVIDGFILAPDRNGPHEKRTVVTPHARMAPRDLKKKEKADFIMPTLWPGQIQFFNLAAIWAAFQSDSAHDDSLIV
jgi:hypothetical protein